MARLRMFASVKEVAGVDQIEVDVSTVGGLVAEADGRFGSDFVRARSGAKLWLNEETEVDDLATPIGREDVVAIIPPVSGGDDSKKRSGSTRSRTNGTSKAAPKSPGTRAASRPRTAKR
ncbi:MAG: MoaD/ThiS family protein [Acidimicrobiia bacterium]|nr:MoaD/ThiS family protein [Acidimicrobiia bacterium]